MKFNPTVKEFLEKKENVTVIGLYWAGTWRFYIWYAAVTIFILGLASLFD